MDSNHRSVSQQIYSLPPLATRESLHPNALTSIDYIITIMVKKQVVSLENITPRSKKIAYPGYRNSPLLKGGISSVRFPPFTRTRRTPALYPLSVLSITLLNPVSSVIPSCHTGTSIWRSELSLFNTTTHLYSPSIRPIGNHLIVSSKRL